MRRLLTLACLFTALAACRRAEPPHPELTVEEPTELRAEIDAANPADEGQLLEGFYALEPGGWRWSAPQFTVTLAVPAEARGKAAVLEIESVIPDAAAAALAGAELRATVDGRELGRWRSPGPGRHRASFRVPGEATLTDSIIADFSLDRFLAPAADSRRLGVIPVRFRLTPAGTEP